MGDAIIGGALSAFIEVVKCVAPAVGHRFSYISNFKTNLDSLKDQIKKLTETKQSVEHRADEARRNGEEVEQEVRTWVASVEKIITEAGKIIEDEEKAKTHCFNMNTRYRFSKDAEQKVNAIVKLQREGKFDKVSYRTIPKEIWIPSTINYQSFESRMSTLMDIQKALKDPNVNMIGVYGMGGIGKTTLVKEIARKAEEEKLFDEVVFALVSETPKVDQIQKDIADRLGLQFDEQSQRGRARRLSESLSRVKKILLILDNVWKSPKLEDIGIPFGDDHPGCKLLLTTRSLDILSCEMNCQNNFLVGTLNEGEAWSLFKKMVGKDFQDSDELYSTASGVASECRGLPVAIVTIARALRNKSEYEWKDALQKLRTPSESNFNGVQREAYTSIELSYKYLEDEELRSIFLLCSLQFNPCHISDLLNYGTGLGLFQGTNTVEEARNRLYTLLNKLKYSCLLLEDQKIGWYAMHDVVRDVALSILCRDKHAIILEKRIGPINWPNRDALKRCTSITLRINNISELPEGWECPQLEYFDLIEMNFGVKIPENFFTGMTKLKALDLAFMRVLSLPSSISLLTNLRTLYLYDISELGDIAIIGELKQLEMLSLNSSKIKQLPTEIGNLSLLKLLDLENCSQLEAIPPDVLSRLYRLEELYLGNTSIQWQTEEINIKRWNASLHELMHLPHLTNLEIHIKDAKILPKGLFSKKLERYRICIGDTWKWASYAYEYEGDRVLKLKLNSNICLEDIWQMKGIEVLYLDEVQGGVNNILHKLPSAGFLQLKRLHVQNSPYFRCIMDSAGWVPRETFPQLESLFIANLIKLEKICNAQLAAESLCKLKRVTVFNCEKLKNIFSFSIANSLPQLQEIKVVGCDVMEEIFAVGSEDDVNNNEAIGNNELAQLRFLTLNSLPHLTSFCSKVKMPVDYEVVSQDQPATPITLFNEMVAMPMLESLEVITINCKKIWQNQLSAISYCFQNLTRLMLQGCDNLNFLFSSSTVGSFLKLQHLEICECPVLKEIVACEELEEEGSEKMVFPQLNILKMEYLESLATFSSKEYVEFPSLTKLQIKRCPKFKAFVLENTRTELKVGKEMEIMSLMEIKPFFNEKVAFPELEEIVITCLDDVKMIWQNNKNAQNSFSKLKSISVEWCDKLQTLFLSNVLGTNILGTFTVLESLSVNNCQSLKNIFPAFIAMSLWQLKKLEIVGCGVLEEIFAKEGGEEPSALRFVFPKVTCLLLQELPEFSTFYPGVYTTEWPVLESLEIRDCNVKVFVSEVQDSKKDQLGISAQQSFSSVQKIFPRLKSLKLRNNIEMEQLFFPLGALAIFYNLKTLELFRSSYKELFSCEDVEENGGNFVQIKSLHLRSLFKLKHMWRRDSGMNSILQNLEILEVQFCGKLVELVPSSASLQNLTTLHVSFCDGMINLVTSSTAKSLEHLREMKIGQCERLIDIVANEGDMTEVVIVFSKLEKLSLCGLRSLTSFCSGNYTFEFPALVELIVDGCPMLKTFCEGALTTSNLRKVTLDREDYTLESDLNSTIQQKDL